LEVIVLCDNAMQHNKMCGNIFLAKLSYKETYAKAKENQSNINK